MIHGTTKEILYKIQADIKKHWKRIFDLIHAYLFEFSYNKAIQLNSMKDEAWYNKGALLDDLGRY